MTMTKTIQGIEGWEERFTELDNKLLKVVYGYLPSGKHRVHRQLDEIDFISNLLSQQATALISVCCEDCKNKIKKII